MTGETEPMQPSLDEIQAWASTEAWDKVDEVIGGVADDPMFLQWAATGIDSEDGNLRDLAASLVEVSSVKPSEEMQAALERHLAADENPYARYRSAFALFKHGRRDQQVIDVIKEAEKDPDVAELARGYLDQL